NVIVLHLNGTFTVSANPLRLSSNTSVLLNGTIQINSSTTAKSAISASASGQTRISISGGTIDGGNLNGHTGVGIDGGSMIWVDRMTIQNLGDNSSHHSGSDSIHFHGGKTPYVVTRCTINKSGARGIWSQLSGQKALYAGNNVTLTRAGIDCDSHTFGAVMMFNTCIKNTYGIFIEQSASHNTAIGNVCTDSDRRDMEVFNNNDQPAVQFNSVVSNVLSGGTGIRNGSTGTGTVTSSNFFFNNVVLNATILAQLEGAENYYSQNYQVGGTFSTSGSETIFNGASVSGNLQIRDSNSGLGIVVAGASTSDGAAIVSAEPRSLGNGSDNDEWAFIPTGSGFYRVMNKGSGLAMVVQGASLSNGAPIIQSAYTADSTFNDEWLIKPVGNGLYNFVNRLSGLNLDVKGASTVAGTGLIQWPSNGGTNQQFSLVEDAPGAGDFGLAVTPDSRSVTRGAQASYTVSVTASNGFADAVSFSVSGLPSGVTASFSPASVTGSGSTTLTVSTSATTPPGAYRLTVTGATGSLSHDATVTLVVRTGCVTAGSTWQNTAFLTQNGTFTAIFDATPSASPINGVMALSNGVQTAYTGFATLVRFNPSGNIDARNAGVYTAASVIPYSGGNTYHFRVVINVPAHTYSIFVTPPGGTELTVGTNFAFRTEQNTVTSLDHFGVFA